MAGRCRTEASVTETYSHLAQAHAFEPTDGYRYLREQRPVYREDSHDPPFYVLSRFEDVRAALKDPRTWSSNDGPGVFFQEAGVLGSTDDPDHARHRRVLRDAFVPTAIDRLEPAASEIADELFAEMLSRGEGDFVDLFAFPFPAMVIGELLGVHRKDRDDFRRWSSEVVQSLTGGSMDDYARARGCIEDYVEARMLEREAAGGDFPDDALTRLLMAWREGVLSIGEVRHLGHQLLIAGHETTTSLLGLMLFRLIERPEVFAQLRADPTLIEAAIEEALRFDSPVQGLFRTNTDACPMHGETIPANSKTQMLYAAANRDPARFADPDEFRLDRGPDESRRHLAFGWGIHFCIGAPLARMQARVTLRRVLAHMHDIELTGPPLRNDSFVLHGLTSLPIRWRTG
jgi:cytochrome P450